MLKRIIRKNKKLIILLLGISISLLIFNFLFKSKNYEITYKQKNAVITEKFDKENKKYTFLFKINDIEFITELEHKYIHKKELVDSIEIKKDKETLCIIPKSKKLDFYPLCYQNNELITYHQLENKDILGDTYFKQIKTKTSSYKKIEINNLNNKKYFIWNYKGFFVIDEKENKTINIFDKDIYNIPLSTKINNNILIADYSNKYKFNKFYIVQTKNNKVKEIITDDELSFESYIMGTNKNKVYFMDKKNKEQYEINTKKLSMNNISKKDKGKVLINGEWEDVSINKLSSKEYEFTYYRLFNYQIIDNNLYLVIDDYKIKISSNVKEIVEVDGETVYYLIEDKLYYFNNTDGEVLVMSYFEWNFNYKNMIYIF